MRLFHSAVLLGAVMSCLSVSVLAIDRASMNSTIQINYGIVERIDRVKMDSNVGKGIVAGGMLGAATSGKHDRGKHAAEGAAAVALLAALAEGNRKAYSYQVRLNTGAQVKLVTESGGIAEGDCVSIEDGKTANIRRVSSVYCEEPQHEVFYHPQVQAAAMHDAAQCHTAKEMALRATTEKDIDIALKKVRIFCED